MRSCPSPLPDSIRPEMDFLRDEIELRLGESPYFALRQVRCTLENGVTVLHGRVTSYYLKQLAQEFARRVAGTQAIENRLEVIVASPDHPPSNANRFEPEQRREAASTASVFLGLPFALA